MVGKVVKERHGYYMKEIRITVIQFEGKLAEREIPSFRGAFSSLLRTSLTIT